MLYFIYLHKLFNNRETDIYASFAKYKRVISRHPQNLNKKKNNNNN